MPSPLPAFQSALFTRLDTDLSETVYDFLPVVDPSTGAAPARPFVAMVQERDQITNTNKAGDTHEVTALLRAESEARGGSEMRTLLNNIITSLDTALTVAGYTVDRRTQIAASRFADVSEFGETLYVGTVEVTYRMQ